MNLKIIFFTVLSFLFLGTARSQQKFLFDATKAEMAGNADWVIDADQHNIGFKNGLAVVGQGNESNPQQFPTPAQSTVVASTPETYWEGGISAWGIDLVKRGYKVETLPYNGKITYKDPDNPQDLSHYNVFVVDEPNIAFSASEKAAIINFVKNGGGLFMISDHKGADRNNNGIDSPHVWNDLMQNNSVQKNPFGITYDYYSFSDKTENIPQLPTNPILHGPMGNVTRVEYYGGTSMTLDTLANSTVKGLVYRSGAVFNNKNVLVAYAKYGKGKVVAMGDSSPADDGTGDPNDRLYNGWTKDANGNHERLIMNASIWLATPEITGIPVNERNKKETVHIQIHNKTVSFVLSGYIKNPIHLIVYNVKGQQVASLQNLKPQKTYSVKLSENGIYIYRIQYNNKQFVCGKFYF